MRGRTVIAIAHGLFDDQGARPARRAGKEADRGARMRARRLLAAAGAYSRYRSARWGGSLDAVEARPASTPPPNSLP